jgi:hypothetical protein
MLECPFCARKCYKMLCFAMLPIYMYLIFNAIQICSFHWQSKGHRFDSDILHYENQGFTEM